MGKAIEKFLQAGCPSCQQTNSVVALTDDIPKPLYFCHFKGNISAVVIILVKFTLD